jgi:hypothetical protein
VGRVIINTQDRARGDRSMDHVVVPGICMVVVQRYVFVPSGAMDIMVLTSIPAEIIFAYRSLGSTIDT